jgi:pimeloyl-ACP methyl ester carboxylesterase
MTPPRTLILLSGLLCDDTIWTDVAQRPASRAEVQIVSFPNFDSIEAMAQWVLANAPQGFALAGHSMGGRVALEVARCAPERIDGAGLVQYRDPYTSRWGDRLVNLTREQGMAAVAAEWLPSMTGAPAERRTVVIPRLVEMVERATPESFAAQTKALLNRPDGSTALLRCIVPFFWQAGARIVGLRCRSIDRCYAIFETQHLLQSRMRVTWRRSSNP